MPEPTQVIRLHLLGALRLDAEGAVAQRSPLSQPRRAALLAYLTLRAARGPERRDTLLGVFWPESDTNHARGALRNALHFLRVSLGAGVIQSHGSEEVQLDLDLLWCDAVEFERLCDAGDLDAALRLYGGHLLEGFFISEAPAFEQWLDGERERLRQLAANAARTLAADAETAGEIGLAALRLRHLLELVPTDEAAARRLMRLLAAADDRGEALRVFGELNARLEHEYGLEPAEETRELADSIRSGPRPATGPAGAPAAESSAVPPTAAANSAPRLPTPAPVPGSAATPAQPVTITQAAIPASAARSGPPPRTPRRLRPVLLAAAAAIVLLPMGVAVLRGLGADPPSADVVAVMPFEYRGAPEHAYLAEGLADLLAANLHGAGELQAVDPRALLASVQSLQHPIEPETARRQAAALGAGLFVLGSVTESAGQLRITAALYRGGARADPRKADVVIEGGADDVLTLVDRMSIALLQGRGTTSLMQSAIRTTGSVEALKSFLHGEAAMRREDVHGAVEHYRRAAEIDSTFALAHYQLSSAAYRLGIARIPAPAAAAALRHAGRLVREDSLLVAAWYHHVAGSVALAHDYYEEALVLRPSHVEAAFQLGELRFHWGAAIGIPAGEAREPFSSVLRAEPHNVDAALHLARLAGRDGRAWEVDTLVAHMRRVDPAGGWSVEMAVLRALLTDEHDAQERALAAAGSRAIAYIEKMAPLTYNLAATERLLHNRLGGDGPPGEQARVQLFLAHVQLARGRYRDAVHGIAAATALPAARRLEYRAMMATLPFLPLSPAELQEVRDELAAYPDMPLQEDGGPFARRGIEYPHVLWPGMFRPRRLYLLAALHVRMGDHTAANAVADSLAREAPGEDLAAVYERLSRGRVALAAGTPAIGLRALGPPEPPPLATFENLVEHARPYERWLRAELLRDAGRIAEALRWYGTFPDPMARDLAYLAPSHLRRAEIHDAAGDLQQAAFHYRRFADLWAHADAELQPQVRRARERLRDIAGE